MKVGLFLKFNLISFNAWDQEIAISLFFHRKLGITMFNILKGI